VIGIHGKDMNNTMAGMADLKTFPLPSSQDKAWHLLVYLKCSQYCWEIIQSFSQHFTALLQQDYLSG